MSSDHGQSSAITARSSATKRISAERRRDAGDVPKKATTIRAAAK